MINHPKSWLAALLATTAVAVVPAGVMAKSDSSSTSAGLRSFHGTVTSVSTADKTFRIKRSGAGTLTFRVTAATVFQRLGARLSARRAGRAVEVKARRADGV